MPWKLLFIISNLHSYTFNYIYTYLVGGFNPSEKYEFVNWDDDDIPN